MPAGPSLQEALGLARSGDRAAFDRLIHAHEGALRSQLAIQLGEGLRGRVEVDDLLQDALLRAFTSLPQFRGETASEFHSWLAGIAHHTVLDRARRLTAQKQDYRREVALGEGGAAGDVAQAAAAVLSSPSQALRREERLARLLAAVEKLAPDHREVIRLSLIEQLPSEEVARRLQRSPKAVSMLLLRAVRALKKSFGDTSSLTLPRPAQPALSDDAGALP
jgi:RNA polymerase sigma-70 factor (ECF subfamily)